MPTREKYEEADPLHGESRDETDPVIPAGVLPHHLEEVSDAVVHALSPTGIGIHRAVTDQGGRDHEDPESSSARAQREVYILTIREEACVECAHRMDYGRVDQHGASGRVVH